jgi:mono/diheme cytochrome c family protein
MKSVMVLTVAVACSLTLTVDVATGSQQGDASKNGGSKNGEEVFLDRCSSCHGTERALAAPRTRRGWESVLAAMQDNGVLLEPAETDAILAFLTRQHGLVNVNAASVEELVALGLSKKDADTIGTYRTDHGPFADFAALQRVPGLDGDRLNAVRARVAFRD